MENRAEPENLRYLLDEALVQFVGRQPKVFQSRYLKHIWQGQLSVLPTALTPLRDADEAFCQLLAEGIYTAGIPALLTDWEHSHAITIKTG